MSEQQAIDRQSPVPYYEQLADVLQVRVENGAIAVGDRLPSELDLSAEYGIARATVRQALQLLESRGLAQRVPNRGVFASRPSSDRGWMIQNTEGFLENAVGRQNRAVTTTVLRSGRAKLPDFVAALLEVAVGVEGFELVRLRHLDGVPAVYSVNYSPPSVAPIVGDSEAVLNGTGSLSELLTRAGYPLRGAHRTIRARAATAEVAEALEIVRGEPVICVQSTSWTKNEERFDVYETWVRTDVVPLEVNVSSVDIPGH
ncbi:GntR family transcriptional regulator [Curtobacterium sp. PhB130]|uniref:GntR family transcriptional regulator n=1 Tax=unclassified Curtobacterium TaxID=257496 RepID=UPI000F4B7A31|nr:MULTISPECIES: GntR family transcriptional regulator [unclassified Curtobacterium]ROS76112.1 GntR family transcriptional regulator [Curtobacterium sp. PhB130]TCK64191.1 GntR family transcriptional regulator [Curtobacterium sp. PhB136]